MIRRLARDIEGATAVEFGLVLPVFVAMMLGLLSVGMLAFSVNSLQFAAEDAARCAAVKTTVCTDASTTRAYALSRYAGPQVSPVFSYEFADCGHRVTATATYDLGLVPQIGKVPLTATACYA
ncbi:TadE family protein [Phenylobacterium sp.]|jgi:Flp pilus assembly pilin Flp|uniref:TadE/TadG family type IV pilus assembly protein n=1 Tax=Phenylobacterium sp. TaxID=1871053 RepID=UPI002F92D3BE